MCVRECVLSSLPRSLQHTLTHPLGLTYFFLNLTRKVTEKKKKRNRTNNKAFVHGKGEAKAKQKRKAKKKKQQKQRAPENQHTHSNRRAPTGLTSSL